MVELEEMNKGFSNVSNNESKIPIFSQDRQKLNENPNKDYIHLQTSYSNGPSKVIEVSPSTREEYL